jgi:thymidylate synthase (FAD)
LEVFLIASTYIDAYGMKLATDYKWEPQMFSESADALTEFAGRLCYQSWNRPNPATADYMDYIAHIIENQDFSVMEHASATVYVRDASRAFSHQMIRHRHFSYSQLSQRYVNERERADWVTPDAIDTHARAWSLYRDAQEVAQEAYAAIVDELEAEGLTRKQARDAARYILPNGQETRMAITGNHRAWREFFGKRRSDRASDEIHEFANEAFDIMKTIAPALYQDMN